MSTGAIGSLLGLPSTCAAIFWSHTSRFVYPLEVLPEGLEGNVSARRFCAKFGHPPAFLLQRVVPFGATQLMIRPVRLRTLFTIRVSTGSRAAGREPAKRSTSS